MSELILREVTKRYGDLEVVKDFSLEVDAGEFIVLVGPSGCGKSTTLRMIAGLEEITRGELIMRGRVVNDVPPKDRDVAMVFQSYALYPHMSVYENMAFGLRLRKLNGSEITRRVQEAARILGITSYLGRKPKALSGGQRQRVAMGRAIVRKPRYFLFDEPLSNLDAKLRGQMRTEIAKLHRRLGATSIYVTHDQVEAMTLADRIVVMKDGVIQQIGRPIELYRKPVNRFVAGFIGSPAMNFLKGTVEEGEVRGEGFQVPVEPLDVAGVTQGQEVILGLRPEAVRVDGTGVGTLEGRVEVREPLGAEAFVYLSVGEQQVVGRFAPDYEAREGDTIVFSVDPAACHVFDPRTESALRRNT